MKIINAQVYGEDGIFREIPVCTDGDRISAESGDGVVIDGAGCRLIPGLVDIHMHGCAGYDYCSAGILPDKTAANAPAAQACGAPANAAALSVLSSIARYEASCGVTTFLPATMTLPEERLLQICRETAAFDSLADPLCAELAGIYMEGPFLSPEKAGAQDRRNLRLPDPGVFYAANAAAGGRIRFLAVAPELEGAEALIRALCSGNDKAGGRQEDAGGGRIRNGDAAFCREPDTEKDHEAGVRITLAHTAADYETACRAFAAGASQVTHLYNAMTGLSHRAPGVAGAAADTDGVYAELICDGIHVHPAVVRQTFRMFGAERIIMISDSMEAAGMPDGCYDLGGQSVRKQGRRAVLAGGLPSEPVLAGSASTLMDCLRTAVLEMHIPLEAAVRCAAANPAKAAGVYDRCGSISIGKKADLVLLDRESLELRGVILRGHFIKDPH